MYWKCLPRLTRRIPGKIRSFTYRSSAIAAETSGVDARAPAVRRRTWPKVLPECVSWSVSCPHDFGHVRREMLPNVTMMNEQTECHSKCCRQDTNGIAAVQYRVSLLPHGQRERLCVSRCPAT